ncbi:MAG: AAA family ATPase [Anaerolineae bacterium]|nr:AAA family ATPase [Anaerolineae bacterium]
MIYTFYSYKGGVGRTMALANVAELFYQAGLRVLMVDWDLEAPGLERFFPSIDLEKTLDKPGVVDMLLHYKAQMAQEVEENVTLELESPAQYVIDIYPDQTRPNKLWLLTAGRRSSAHFTSYAQTVLSFDWQDFYKSWEGERYFDWLREQFESLADVILIDSRTGVTEMGGVCTYQLADAVVMFCATNQQNLEGTQRMAQNLTAPVVQKLRRGRSLNVLIIPARVERAESPSLDNFKKDFIKRFGEFTPKNMNITELWAFRIPYVPKYAYNELVAVRESREASAEDMAIAFKLLYQGISKLDHIITFADRQDEISKIISLYAPAYYLIDAPAGYGKTELLRELEKRFQEKGWRCAYVAIDENDTYQDILWKLAIKLDVELPRDTSLESQSLGRALCKIEWGTEQGLLLLLDLEKKPSPSILQNLIKDLVPEIQSSLKSLDFSQSAHNPFRVIIAGRYIAAHSNEHSSRISFNPLLLEPFNYDVLHDIARYYLNNETEDSISELAAHLMYLTGGHPGCVAQILKSYKDSGWMSDDLVVCELQTCKGIVQSVAEEVYDELPASIVGFNTLIERLSLFRYLDYALLDHFAQDANLPEIPDATTLSDHLTITCLFSRDKRLIKDDIVRRLLAIRIRDRSQEEFVRLCQKAQALCLERLQDPRGEAEVWCIEYLFEVLQEYAGVIQDEDQRSCLRKRFWDKEVPFVLRTYFSRGLVEQIEFERSTLIQMVERDWEFQFMVNYYLREQQYNDRPYRSLSDKISNFKP